MRRLSAVFIGSVAFLVPAMVFSAGLVPLTPVLTLPEVDQVRRLNADHSQTFMLKGHGDRLEVLYTSDVPMDLDVSPMKTSTSFDPEDLMHVTLPAGTEQTAVIDLTVSPGWSPWNGTYYIGLYAMGKEPKSNITSMQVAPAGMVTIVRSALSDLGYQETYQVSTPHALRGIRVLSVSLGSILSVVLLLIVMIFFMKRDTTKILVACVSVVLFSGALFDVQLLRFTGKHLASWYGNGTYEMAGSAVEIGKVLHDGTPVDASVFVCTKSTDYYTKMLRYFTYPRQISLRPEDVQRAKIIVVHDSPGWSFTDGILRCGNIEGPATEIARYPDGSAIFAAGHL